MRDIQHCAGGCPSQLIDMGEGGHGNASRTCNGTDNLVGDGAGIKADCRCRAIAEYCEVWCDLDAYVLDDLVREGQ